jgi:glycosyltransferase involved in cell wall biosynthesis
MRVMFVCTTGGSGRRQFGGAERMLIDLIPAHARNNVEVVACTSDDEVGRSLRDAGVPWIDLSAARRIDLTYVRGLRRAVREVRPDVVCAHLLSAAMHSRAALSVERPRTPLVVTLHASLWQLRDTARSTTQKAAVQSNIMLDLALRRLRPHASVAVSQYEADELRVRGKVKNVHLIPNPLPADWPSHNAAWVSGSPRPIRVGYLGRLEKEKGADLLADIASSLPDARFKIAGDGSVPIAARPNLELVGRVNAADFLSRIDCLVVPSRVEAFGLSALEALSLGVPVVHSGAGGLTEVTGHADGILAFRSELTPVAMAAAIRRATSTPAPERRLAIAKWYAEQYAFERCVERWHNLYRSLLP